MSDPLIVIFARNRPEAETFRKDQGLGPRDYIYATSKSLRGRDPKRCDVRWVGEWYKNPDYQRNLWIHDMWIPESGQDRVGKGGEKMTVTPVEIGDLVVLGDEEGKEHLALVTTTFNPYPGTEAPGVNVVFVSDDANKTDPYGRQVERRTSVVHQSAQPAHGLYWRHATASDVKSLLQHQP